ncbi:hypothetical protein [Nitratiruptor sp. YY08-13]|uniref:hypothetical protein n=1 Tax=Nitratiruptor sp. YY08-13 TaxID=2724898 RepID=UPI001F329079|nr:hypothetical protein [Nitratiruptor sp. YY08-13]
MRYTHIVDNYIVIDMTNPYFDDIVLYLKFASHSVDRCSKLKRIIHILQSKSIKM